MSVDYRNIIFDLVNYLQNGQMATTQHRKENYAIQIKDMIGSNEDGKTWK